MANTDDVSESDIVEVTPWAPGVAVGRYQLVAQIASGGMAEIWLARQSGVHGFEKVVVIKRMIVTLEAEPEHVEMFLTEARLAAQLTHPNVVQIFELGEEEGSFYIVMEYLDGESLSTVRRAAQKANVAIPDAIWVRLIALAAEGLHYAHTRTGRDGQPLTIIHRDVSPQNLIVTFDGSVKVVDFGIAKIESQATNSGKLKGKLSYMAPEQARGDKLDPRADVFALGIVLFEALTGTRFFPKLEDLEMLNFILSDRPLPRAIERRANLPAPLVGILDKVLARNRNERYQSAREFQAALEDWIRVSGERASSSEIADVMRGLFGTQMRDRRSLIQAAMAGELTPTRVPQTFARPGSRSITGPLPKVDLAPPAPPDTGRRTVVIAAVAAAVALAGVAAVTLLRKPEAPPAPAVQLGVLTIESEPPGAAIQVDDVSRGTTPVVIEGVALGKRRISASLTDYEPATQTVNLTHPGERTQVMLSLHKKVVAPPVAATPTPPKTPVVAGPRPKGRLTLSTVPWTSVFLGTVPLGDTPLVNVPVPAGKQNLRLVNQEKGINNLVEVEIKPNETTVMKLRL